VLRVRCLPPALEVPHDRGGVERIAVVELHALAELERPHLAVARDVPLLGERRLDLGRGAAVLHETVEDLSREARGDAVGDDGRIELDRLALSAEHECLSRHWNRRAHEGRGDQRREHGKPHGKTSFVERSPVRAGPLSHRAREKRCMVGAP
jgi:hypothetical protein